MAKKSTRKKPTKRAANSAPKDVPSKNLPTVSKQTAGGVGGAVIGGILAGPIGALAGGVAGALVGNASAEGRRPVKRAAAKVAEVASNVDLSKVPMPSMPKMLTGGKKKTAKKPAKKAAPTGASTAKKAAKKVIPKKVAKKAGSKKAPKKAPKKAKR